MSNEIKNDLDKLASKYDNLKVHDANYNSDGSLTMDLQVSGPSGISNLESFTDSNIDGFSNTTTIGSVSQLETASSVLNVNPLQKSDLDLLSNFDINTATPQQLYRRSILYCKTKGMYSNSINILSNFAAKGFENDINDSTIKNFFDVWVMDTNFDEIVEKIFYDFFRIGLVRTYKIIGKYEPSISHVSPIPGKSNKKVKKGNTKEKVVKSKNLDNSYIPIAYTILNPTLIAIEGSLMFGKSIISLDKKAGEELKTLLELPKKDLSPGNRRIIDSLPRDWKKAIKKGENLPLQQELVGEVDYRKMPYERYPIPRASGVFEDIQFKDELRKADYSTLDGITNYILKITIGNDSRPVTQESLENVSELFNTVSKSFKVVWDHTLKIEKITSPEIGDILGQDKYKQVNEDIAAGIGVSRPFLDGGGQLTTPSAELSVKSLVEEVNYARRQVKRWIYSEYKQVAKAMGFDRIPKVRFDDTALVDQIKTMSVVQGLIDRRIISYKTGQTKLGFDYDTELHNLQLEKELVVDGTLGLLGSPYQQSKQNSQNTPKGTPSEGRPTGKPTKANNQQVNERDAKMLQSLSVEQLQQLIELKKNKEP